MHFGVRQTAAAVSAAALIFCCSCEKHHLGEDPEVQKQHVDVPGGPEEPSAATKQASAPPSATTSPAPLEFFPERTPHQSAGPRKARPDYCTSPPPLST